MRISEERAQQVSGLVFAGVWMWPLLGPAMDIVHGNVHPTAVAAIGFGAFVVAYLVVVVDAFDNHPRLSRRTVWLLNLVVAALGTALAASYATVSNGWLEMLLYVAVTGAVTTGGGSISALSWIGGWTAALVVVGLVRGESWSNVGSLAFSSVMAGVLVFTIRQMVGLIRELKRTQRELADAAVERERLRFSRDLHDLLGHTLSLMVVKAELTRRLAPVDGEAAAREADDIETIGRRALLEVREAVTGYRARSLAQELDGSREALADAGIEVIVRTTGTPLTLETDDMFAWAVREGVTNVIRHSRATRCDIDIRRVGANATLTIADNGPGSPDTCNSSSRATANTSPAGTQTASVSASRRAHALAVPGLTGQAVVREKLSPRLGNGLRGLAERAHSVGGELRVASTPGTGFTLTVSVPVVGDPSGGGPDCHPGANDRANANDPEEGLTKPEVPTSAMVGGVGESAGSDV